MTTTATISDLPRHLIEEIISMLPMESMKAVRLTCKSWNIISKSESFAKLHIGKVTRQGETMMIAAMPQKIYLMSGFVDGVDPSLEHKCLLRLPCNQVINICEVTHYEGLLLCKLEDITKILVWNPYWGQTRWIDLRVSHCPQGYFNYTLGYEDKESYRHFKVLRFLDYFHRAPEVQFYWYEIYDFDSGLWTTLDVDAPYWGIYCSSRSVSLKGNSYWCCTSERSSSEGGKDHIICFDFTRERFGPLLTLPSCVRDRKYVHVSLSCVKEEKIAALFQHDDDLYDSEFEIWITTKIEADIVSWSKFLRIDTERRLFPSDYFFIDEEKKVFMCVGRDYDYHSNDCTETFIKVIIGEAGYLNDFHLGVPAYKNHWPCVCSYVPSFVQIKKLARGKRIEQSSLEKRRFDQNMLRLAAVEKLMKQSR